jgi:hypothetical protein
MKALIGRDRAKQYGLLLSSDSQLTVGQDKFTSESERRRAQAVNLARLEAERKKDQYSHFVLRLAFCRR